MCGPNVTSIGNFISHSGQDDSSINDAKIAAFKFPMPLCKVSRQGAMWANCLSCICSFFVHFTFLHIFFSTMLGTFSLSVRCKNCAPVISDLYVKSSKIVFFCHFFFASQIFARQLDRKLSASTDVFALE